jgi:undecaprenyl-diphosphatase
MHKLLEAAILGLVQGLTEFLPVSSSGHLILFRDLMGWQLLNDEHLNKLFDVVLHAGTFLALVLYFWRDVVQLLGSFLRSLRYGIKNSANRRIAWAIVIGTVPAALAGVAGEKLVERKLGTPLLIAIELIVFALVLLWADRAGRKKRSLKDTRLQDGLFIGLAQAIALAPGVSRSGITMTAGLARGMKRETAARFSFLLSIPIVGGAALKGLHDILKDRAALPDGSMALFAVGLLTAAVSGVLVIGFLLKYLQSRSLTPFVIYRLALGLALLALIATGTLK